MHYPPLLHIVLYQPEIHYNAGSVGRTCVAVGAKLWLVRPLGFHVDDHHLRRAGLDYWQHLEWEVTEDWNHLRQRLAERSPGGNWYYFSNRAEKNYWEPSYQPGDVMVFGSESRGLPDAMVRQETALRVPIRDAVRSLNLSNTVAIASYEALRQLGPRGGGSRRAVGDESV